MLILANISFLFKMNSGRKPEHFGGFNKIPQSNLGFLFFIFKGTMNYKTGESAELAGRAIQTGQEDEKGKSPRRYLLSFWESPLSSPNIGVLNKGTLTITR